MIAAPRTARRRSLLEASEVNPVSRRPASDFAVPGRRIAVAFLLAQLAVMLAFSAYQYEHFALTKDFAASLQAVWSIAHGHLDPYSTVIGTSFWRNNGEFLTWPIAWLYALAPHPLLLLWLQDGVVVLTGYVAFSWAADAIVARRRDLPARAATLALVGVALVIAVDPWAYETIAWDVHSHVFACLFVVLAGRDLWGGRTRRLWLWVPLALASSALGALCVAGLGVTGLVAGPRARSWGAAMLAAGAGWFVLLSQVGADGVGGQALHLWYGYLTGPHAGRLGVVALVMGVVHHPGVVAHTLWNRLPRIVWFLVPLGLVGVLSPWALGVATAVFLPSALVATPDFIQLRSAFQFWPALPFVVVGTVMVLTRLCNRRVPRRVCVVSACVWLICALVVTSAALPTVPRDWLSIGPRAAVELGKVQAAIPANAEVVVSNGIAGRFGARKFVYVLGYRAIIPSPDVSTELVPVRARVVVFVISPREGIGMPYFYGSAVQYVRDVLRARVLAARSGIYAFEWTPPEGTTAVTIR